MFKMVPVDETGDRMECDCGCRLFHVLRFHTELGDGELDSQTYMVIRCGECRETLSMKAVLATFD